MTTSILLHRFATSLAIGAALFCGATALSAGAKTNRFAKDGVAFDYPDDWSITDVSTPEALHLLTRKSSSVQIMIILKRDLTLRNEVQAAKRSITEPLIEKIARKIGEAGKPVERATSHIEIGGSEAEGLRLRASSRKKQMTAEVFWLRTLYQSCFREIRG